MRLPALKSPVKAGVQRNQTAAGNCWWSQRASLILIGVSSMRILSEEGLKQAR